MNENLGIMEEQQRLRESATRNLTPAARHQAFPALFAKPMPANDPAAEVARLTVANETLRAKNRRLEKEKAGLADLLRVAMGDRPAATPAAPPPPPSAPSPAIRDVQDAFCKAFNAAGGQAGFDEPYTIEHLQSERRSAVLARPRHVCMALCRTICVGQSLPSIGRAFGHKDHTSVMHGVRRAVVHRAADPVLAAVHAKVLAAFEAKK
jgi:hypothetical protein